MLAGLRVLLARDEFCKDSFMIVDKAKPPGPERKKCEDCLKRKACFGLEVEKEGGPRWCDNCSLSLTAFPCAPAAIPPKTDAFAGGAAGVGAARKSMTARRDSPR